MRRRRRRSRPHPQHVHGLPIRTVDSRVPACQRLGMRRQVSAPTPMGGVRFYPNRRTNWCPPLLSLNTALAREHELTRFPHSSTTDASTACPSRTMWRLARCLGVVCAVVASPTSLWTAVDQRQHRPAWAVLTTHASTTHRPPHMHLSTVHQLQKGL